MGAFKRPKNLGDLLVHSRMGGHIGISRTTGCGQKWCQICKHFICTNELQNIRTKQIDYIWTGWLSNQLLHLSHHLSTLSKTICGSNHTNTHIRSRMMQHLNDIKSNDQFRPVAIHFNLSAHTCTGVELWKGESTSKTGKNCHSNRYQHNIMDINRRLAYESAWIRLLSTQQPWRMNIASWTHPLWHHKH